MQVLSTVPGHCALILHIVEEMTTSIKKWQYNENLTPILHLLHEGEPYNLVEVRKKMNQGLSKLAITSKLKKWELNYSIFEAKFKARIDEVYKSLQKAGKNKVSSFPLEIINLVESEAAHQKHTCTKSALEETFPEDEIDCEAFFSLLWVCAPKIDTVSTEFLQVK